MRMMSKIMGFFFDPLLYPPLLLGIVFNYGGNVLWKAPPRFFSFHTHFCSPVGTGEALANIISRKITFGFSSLSLEASLVSSSVVDSAASVALSTSSFLLVC